MPLYDYLYVDRAKVVSLYSQLVGGVVESMESNSEQSNSADNKRNYNFRVFEHNAGGTDVDKKSRKEVIKPHHSILLELEAALQSNGYMLEFGSKYNRSLRDTETRKLLELSPCIKVSGRAVIEDYERIKGVAQVFPDLLAFINKSIESSNKETPAYKELQTQLSQLQTQLRNEKDRDKKKKYEELLKTTKHQVETMISTFGTVKGVDQWVLDGLKKWIDSLLPGIINLRIYPDMNRPDEHIFGQLKRECFEESDSTSFHFTHGSFPTGELSVVGLVTSVPAKDGEAFQPLAELQTNSASSQESFENGFRSVFRGFDGLEQLIRTSRYPRVIVQPLVVYRTLQRVDVAI